jgi:hypothetical protein
MRDGVEQEAGSFPIEVRRQHPPALPPVEEHRLEGRVVSGGVLLAPRRGRQRRAPHAAKEIANEIVARTRAHVGDAAAPDT